LNAHHPEGKHKAKVFASLLGVTHFDAEWLKDQIIVALRVNFAIEQEPSPFGKRYAVDMLISNGEKKVILRTAWIIRNDESFPRLTTCYIV